MTDKSINSLQFETSTACNAECSMCRHKDMSRKGHMSLADIIDLTYHLAHKSKEVCPFWMQEPTLDKRMPDILSNIKCLAPKTKTTVYSNMGHYPKETWKQILEAGTLDQLIISFFGTDEDTYKTLQSPLDFETTKNNIKKLYKLRSKLAWKTPNIRIRLLITPETYTKTKQFTKQWSPYCDDVAFTFLENWNGSPEEVLEFNKKVWGPPAQRVPCARLYNSMTVASNGDVAACCMDYNVTEKLGNVFTDGYDVWHKSKYLQNLRKMHERGEWDKIPICKDCTVYAYNQSKEWIQYWMNNKEFVVSAINR